ncbi:putative esterase [Gordonia hirsuta DSM 44140 = NBRC 16056]|uniref:Putative esterase n=1 Tax=Gordonia hirsuta DSM 44140 = NBRC 16056 TaxID=1121927 RepID=L7L7N5_9ACTN|nr:alpha/beta hydrolase [Gordonia hirsuta]GAC56018.1 putative esterase [Gordonia hirsuta DSM 44140 = NBRC 16056]
MEQRSGVARAGDLEVVYDEFGDRQAPPVLLIMGLGAQMVYWREDFCRRIADDGYRVIRFDNRDVGLTSKLDGVRVGGPPLPLRLGQTFLGRPVSGAPYTLLDMASDARAVLDHLDVERAHIVGASMGGMITQVFAAEHADRTSTATVIMSSNNQAFLPPPGPQQLRALISPPPRGADRERLIAHRAKVGRIIGSPVHPASWEQSLAHSAEYFDRNYYPAGFLRQFAAIQGTGSLVGYNKRTTAPTLVLHGTHDRLMRPSGAKAIARAVPGARLTMVDGMAHDLPEPLWDEIVTALTGHFAQRP